MQYFVAVLIQNSELTIHINGDFISYRLAYVTSHFKQKKPSRLLMRNIKSY